MPEAIATTKRKFYKALDALTMTASQTASHNNALAESVSNKRPVSAAIAFDEARDRVRKRLRQSTSTTSLSEDPQIPLSTSFRSGAHLISTVRKLAQHGPGVPEKALPNFSPWSHDAFITRLKTFSSVSRWHPKPEAISEVEWAKRGWSCVDVDTVACRGGCERRVVVDLDASVQSLPVSPEPDRDNLDVVDDDDKAGVLEESMVERYRSEIISGHAENCLWQKTGCKSDIYRLQVVRPPVWQPELGKRFRSLLNIDDAISRVRFTAMNMDDQKVVPISRLIKDLPGHVLGSFDAPPAIAETALQVALHGWHGSSESGNQLLMCDVCFQRIGLWMYQPDYRPSTRDSSTAANDEDETVEQPGTVDLENMHREHCPWRNPYTQQAAGSLSGLNACQVLQRVAATCARDHRRRTGEHTSGSREQADHQGEADGESVVSESPRPTREEIAAQDRERESRLRKLKNLFTLKRRPTLKPSKRSAV